MRGIKRQTKSKATLDWPCTDGVLACTFAVALLISVRLHSQRLSAPACAQIEQSLPDAPGRYGQG